MQPRRPTTSTKGVAVTKKNDANSADAPQESKPGVAGATEDKQSKGPLAAYRGDLTAAEEKAAKMVDYRQ